MKWIVKKKKETKVVQRVLVPVVLLSFLPCTMRVQWGCVGKRYIIGHYISSTEKGPHTHHLLTTAHTVCALG